MGPGPAREQTHQNPINRNDNLDSSTFGHHGDHWDFHFSDIRGMMGLGAAFGILAMGLKAFTYRTHCTELLAYSLSFALLRCS